MKFKAAIFDLDGTLIDSTWVWDEMMKDFHKEYGIKSDLNYVNETVHMPPSEFVEFIKREHGLKESVFEIKSKIEKIAAKLYKTKVPLKKGVYKLLSLMKKNSIKMAVATSCFVELTEIILKKWKIYDMFSCFMYSEKLNTNKKTAYLYLAAAEKLNVPKEQCAVFEDILIPLKAVKEQCMGYFAVEDKRRDEEIKKELKLNADYYIKDFDEFIEEGSFAKFFSVKGEAI